MEPTLFVVTVLLPSRHRAFAVIPGIKKAFEFGTSISCSGSSSCSKLKSELSSHEKEIEEAKDVDDSTDRSLLLSASDRKSVV